MRFLLLAVSAITLAACQGAEFPSPGEIGQTPLDSSTSTAAVADLAAEHTQGAHVEAHDHGSPHGGTVKPAGAGHLELVVDGRDLKVYPLDAAEAALPVAGIAGAQALVQPDGGASLTGPLAPMGDHLHGAIPASVTVYTSVVTVPVAGETRSARFEVGLDGDLDHAH